MNHALVHSPQIGASFIEEFRKIYNLYFALAIVHITCLFGIPNYIGTDIVEKYMPLVLAAWTLVLIY